MLISRFQSFSSLALRGRYEDTTRRFVILSSPLLLSFLSNFFFFLSTGICLHVTVRFIRMGVHEEGTLTSPPHPPRRRLSILPSSQFSYWLWYVPSPLSSSHLFLELIFLSSFFAKCNLQKWIRHPSTRNATGPSSSPPSSSSSSVACVSSLLIWTTSM